MTVLPWLRAIARRPLSPALATIAVLIPLPRAGSHAPPQPTATIYRDTWGVPHIYADREEDGFYAFGYAMAEDELDFILRSVLVARGEAAAAFGKDQVESDYTSRLWRHKEESKVGFRRLSPALQRDYRRWAQGINRYLADHPGKRPAWAPTVEPWDAVAISRWLLWLSYQAGDGLSKCRASGVRLSAVAEQGLADRRVAASNEWVVAPARTKDHAMIVLSDPHGGVDGQFVYEFRMHAGRFEAAGYAMGALPLLVHTRNVSWGMTTGAPSVADCYRVKLEPGSETRYRYDGSVREIIRESTVIPVKDGEPVTRTLEYTRHNDVLSPIVAREPGMAYAVSTTYMHRAGDFDEELHRMILAKNVAEVKAAMRLLGMFPQNVMVGDRYGASWYVRAGRTPRRPAGVDWKKALDGNTSRTAWLGIHPLEDLVQIENPPSGYMQNNNISPSMMFEGSPLTPDRYPADIYDDVAGRTNSRARRVVEVLSRAHQFSVADAKDLALDEMWVDTEQWKEALRRSLAGRDDSVSGGARALADEILGFDGNARAGSRAALGYWFWRTSLIESAGVKGAQALLDGGAGEAGPTPTAAAAAIAALDRAAGAIDTTRGKVCATPGSPDCPPITLGDVFRIGRGGKSSYPIGGVGIYPAELQRCRGASEQVCVSTLRAFIAAPPDSTGHRFIILGSRLLRLAIFTDPIQSFTLHNFGQSSDPQSPHWDDQARLSSRRELKPVWFDKADLMKHVESTERLVVPK